MRSFCYAFSNCKDVEQQTVSRSWENCNHYSLYNVSAHLVAISFVKRMGMPNVP